MKADRHHEGTLPRNLDDRLHQRTVIIIGQDCDDDGLPAFPPVGLPNDQLHRIQQALLTFCTLIQPPFFPTLSIEHVEERALIVLRAPGGQMRPYKVPRDVTHKKAPLPSTGEVTGVQRQPHRRDEPRRGVGARRRAPAARRPARTLRGGAQ